MGTSRLLALLEAEEAEYLKQVTARGWALSRVITFSPEQSGEWQQMLAEIEHAEKKGGGKKKENNNKTSKKAGTTINIAKERRISSLWYSLTRNVRASSIGGGTRRTKRTKSTGNTYDEERSIKRKVTTTRVLGRRRASSLGEREDAEGGGDGDPPTSTTTSTTTSTHHNHPHHDNDHNTTTQATAPSVKVGRGWTQREFIRYQAEFDMSDEELAECLQVLYSFLTDAKNFCLMGQAMNVLPSPPWA